MEIVLSPHATEEQIVVTCEGQPSHTFDPLPLYQLFDAINSTLKLQENPVYYGTQLYKAVFPINTLARQTLDEQPERIVLTLLDDKLDALPWEYLYGPEDAGNFLVLEYPFVRALALMEKRLAPPDLASAPGLHIVAVPSQPLSPDIPALNIGAEWQRLRDTVEALTLSALTLERLRPPTIEALRASVAGQKQRVVHFMGHGGQSLEGAVLCFEKENGTPDLITTKELVKRVKNNVFLVTLNACVSAAPGATPFSNLAASLVRQRVPYALGMRFPIHDDDARIFARTFYNDIARGVTVEEALFQARLSLEKSSHFWVIGTPVLYTALKDAAPGFPRREGTSRMSDPQPLMEVDLALPRAEGIFKGRINDLTTLGTYLTGDQRSRILTIHGAGGQGKTALAREAVERFAHAWSGGVWATSLENLPERAVFANELARFLKISTDGGNAAEIERQIFARLLTRRLLIVLDNAETLIHALEANDAQAVNLIEFIQQLPGATVSLLITSRVLLGLPGEVAHELGGLSPEEGADFFTQSVPQRQDALDPTLTKTLSRKVDGHPLSLRLLAGAFNTSGIELSTFVTQHEEQLAEAENKYVGEQHRQRKLYASIEISVRYLNEAQRNLLGCLSVFHAPFLAEAAVAICDPDAEDSEERPSPVWDQLHQLWQRSLLEHKTIMTREGKINFYYLLPIMRPYIDQYIYKSVPSEVLLALFSKQYASIAGYLYDSLDKSARAVVIAQQTEEDLERGLDYTSGIEQGYYQTSLAGVLSRLGARRRSLKLLEQALEGAQSQDQTLMLLVLNNLAMVYHNIGQPQQALSLHKQALPIMREVGDRAGEAATLNNMAMVYRSIGQPQQALSLHEQALPIMREVGKRAGEAITLNNMAMVYHDIGQPQQALTFYEQVLPIMREVGDRAGEAITLNNMAMVYPDIGQAQQALSLHEQALLIRREVGDRAGEAITLNNMAMVYHDIGQLQQALSLYEQVLPIMREVDDRAGEAATLNNLAGVYHDIGQPQRALSLYQQALPIRREVGDRTGEATTLSNLATVYRAIGQLQRALSLYEQALPINQEVSDRAGEATILTNMAETYRAIGQPHQALTLYEQALPIRREVGNRAGEATILNNMALVYHDIGQAQRALRLYEQALSIQREVGDRKGEATTLSNLARVYQTLVQLQQALSLYQQALPIRREVSDRTGEAATLINIAYFYRDSGNYAEAETAFTQSIQIAQEIHSPSLESAALVGLAKLLYQSLHRSTEAIKYLQQALNILTQTDLPQDGAGHTPEEIHQYIQAMSRGRE